jgi:hypothetical protein
MAGRGVAYRCAPLTTSQAEDPPMRPTFLLFAMLVGLAIALLLFITSKAIRDALNRGRQRFYLWNLRMLADSPARPWWPARPSASSTDPAASTSRSSSRSTRVTSPRAAERWKPWPCQAPRSATSCALTQLRDVPDRRLRPSVSAAGVITFSLENNTAGALDEGNNIWDCIPDPRLDRTTSLTLNRRRPLWRSSPRKRQKKNGRRSWRIRKCQHRKAPRLSPETSLWPETPSTTNCWPRRTASAPPNSPSTKLR